MRKNVNTKEKNLIIKLVTLFLVLFAIFCTFIIIKNNNHGLIPGLIGVILLIITMNISNVIKINKEKIKLISIISIILDIISIPLIFKQIIFSYVLIVPAFILSKKSMKKDSRNVITKIAFILSSLALIVYLALSIIAGCTNVINLSKL